MPRKDLFHDAVVHALAQDGWLITDDPLRLAYGGRNLFVDLGAEQPIAAEKAGRKIAVEIKGFLEESDVHELGESIGQYRMYRNILAELEPERELYMAVPVYAYNGIFQEPLGQLMVVKEQLRLTVFDEVQRRIDRWIP